TGRRSSTSTRRPTRASWSDAVNPASPLPMTTTSQIIIAWYPDSHSMKQTKAGAVIRVSLGNFLEMYDFMVFGYYAAAIGRAFFPTHNEYASLMLSFMTFGTGY